MSMSRRGGGPRADKSLDDVQVLGEWNFTLEGDTPLFWIRSGALESYLLQFKVHTSGPSTAGLIIHAEQDGTGADGVSFWMERSAGREGRQGQKRYMLAGDGLESSSIATRGFPDAGEPQEELVEVLVQGYTGTVLLQDRKMKLAFRTRNGRGCIAFYNSTQADTNDEVHFSGVRVTALRKGPMEIAGTLGKREHTIRAPGEAEDSEVPSTTIAPTSMQDAPSWQSTATPASSRAFAQVPGHGSSAKVAWSTSGMGKTGPGRKGAGLRPSPSDGLLQGAGASALGLRSTGAGAKRRQEETWGAFALNAPAGEMALLKASPGTRKAPSSSACNDFIAM